MKIAGLSEEDLLSGNRVYLSQKLSFLPALPMKIFALRLEPNQDLRRALKEFAIAQNLQAAFILVASMLKLGF